MRRLTASQSLPQPWPLRESRPGRRRLVSDERETTDGYPSRLRGIDGGGAEQGLLETAIFEIKRVIAGQDEMLERVFVCLLAGGHLLIEGVPGLAKTLTVKTVA